MMKEKNVILAALEDTANYNTPYDDAYMTLIDKCPRLVIPLINEMFSENFSPYDRIVGDPNEYYVRYGDGDERKIATDSVFSIIGSTRKKYHIECQSTADGSMIIRIFEYDTHIALRNAVLNDDVLTVAFPESGIIYLRSTRETPEYQIVRIITSEGSADHKVKVLKLSDYNADSMFSKDLLLLIPFLVFNYESNFDRIEADEREFESFYQRYKKIRSQLDILAEQGVISEFEKPIIVDMTKRVIRAIARKHERIKEASTVVGGVVLETEAQKILDQGIEKGIKQGTERAEENMAKLNNYLIDSNRIDDLKHASNDAAFRAQIYEEMRAAGIEC